MFSIITIKEVMNLLMQNLSTVKNKSVIENEISCRTRNQQSA